MNLFRTHLSSPRSNHEAVFVDRYARLMSWALRLTRGDNHAAEDLVHDAFVQFTLASPELSTIDNLDAYLYVLLKHLHLSQLRRATRDVLEQSPVVDFDSVALALRASTRADTVETQNELRLICAHCCWWKQTNKSACILILRFFHGYFPREIAEICRLPLAAIYHHVQLARQEVRQHLAESSRPRVVGAARAGEAVHTLSISRPTANLRRETVLSDLLLHELRTAIFQAKQGECPGREALLDLYKKPEQRPVRGAVLAHIASCEECLNIVNDHFGHSRLRVRSPLDATQSDERGDNCGGDDEPPPSILTLNEAGRSRTGSSGWNKKKAPAAKRLLENGKLRRSEVFHHRPQHLLIAVNGDLVASHSIQSDVSELRVHVDRSVRAEFVEVLSEQGIRLLLLPIEELLPEPPKQEKLVDLSDGRSLKVTLESGTVGLSVCACYHDPELAQDWVPRADLEDDAAAGAFAEISPASDSSAKPERLSPLRRSLWQRLESKLNFRAITNMNPVLSSAVIIAVAVVGLIAIWQRNLPRVTASEFLERASTSDSSISKNTPDGVVCQKLRIRTSKGTTEQTVYRDLAGHRRVRLRKREPEAAQLEAKLAIAGIGLDDPLSAASFRNWHDRQDEPRDEIARRDEGRLTLRTMLSNGSIAAESVTVRESNFHPVERIVEFTGKDEEIVEIAELGFAVLGWEAVNEALFEPLPGALSVTPVATSASLSPLRATVNPSKDELDEAELGARLVLNQLQADSTGRIEVFRNPTGVEVKGIVPTEDQKRELQRHLRSLTHVTPSILSFEDANSRPAETHSAVEPGNTRIQAASVVAQASPLEKYLVEHAPNRDDVSVLPSRLFNASLAVVQETKALSDLHTRFPSAEALTEKSSTAFRELVRSHGERLLAAVGDEEKILVDVTGLTLSGTQHSSSSPAGSVQRALSMAEQNLALCKELTTGTDAQTRPAHSILTDLAESITQLRELVRQLRSDLQDPLSDRSE